MEINIRMNSISKMLELCKKHKKGEMDRKELEELLNHDDYEVEFKRYNIKELPMTTITKDEFIDYFMNILTIDVTDIKNKRLRIHHEAYMYLFDNLEFYEEQINKLYQIDKKTFEEGLQYTFNGIPSDMKFNRLDFIFTISIGNSFGWPYGNFVHFDVIQFFKIFGFDKIEELKAFIGHEVHHIAFGRYIQSIKETNPSLEKELCRFIAFEGLAVKYCNNGEGILTKRLYEDIEPNLGMDKFTWKYFREEFEDMFKNFKTQIRDIREGKIKDMKDLGAVLADYWLSLHTQKQDKIEIPRLMHSKNYYFGCEIWGLIHDVYGKEKVFHTLRNMDEFPEVLNGSLKKIGREDLFI